VNSSPKSTFERCALTSGLLTEEQIQQAWAAVEHSQRASPGASGLSSDQMLASKLVELGWLNVWQTEQLLQGRHRFDLGSYRIVDSIGRGGMGEVYKAEHGVLGRTVAIKVLPRRKSAPEDIANFLREARVLARLDHENLVRAFDAGEDQSVYYLVTEYVPGTDLRKLVRVKGPLSVKQAASVVSQVALALHHAHEQGLIHRDVKPGNVLVTPDGRAKLSDLGLAGPSHGGLDEDPRLGKIVGTADYLSPDHIEAPWNPTPAWDIYSLGCTLYYAVTGKVPFPGGATLDKVRAHRQLRPLDPRRLNPNLSTDFVDVIADMMAKNPAERIGSAKEVAERLAPWVEAADVPLLSNGASSASVAEAGTGDWTSQPPAIATDGSGSSGALADTQGSDPGISGVSDLPRDPAPQSSEITHPVGAASQETYPRVPVSATDSADSPSVLIPFAVLVLFPLTVVAGILFVWWASRLLF
jgi:serine/threonine protein kinase